MSYTYKTPTETAEEIRKYGRTIDQLQNWMNNTHTDSPALLIQSIIEDAQYVLANPDKKRAATEATQLLNCAKYYLDKIQRKRLHATQWHNPVERKK